MTETISRQPQGIPSGGQFAPTAHAEPEVTLPPGVPAYDHEAQQERLTAISEKRQAMDRLQAEMDLLNVDAAIASVRRYFPEATELHASTTPATVGPATYWTSTSRRACGTRTATTSPPTSPSGSTGGTQATTPTPGCPSTCPGSAGVSSATSTKASATTRRLATASST